MKKLLILLLLLGSIHLPKANAQNYKQFSYSYDEAGNRIKRTYKSIPCPNPATCRVAKTDTVAAVVVDSTSKVLENIQGTIKIYPNPTKYSFIINNNYNKGSLQMQLFDIKGQLIYNGTVENGETQIDVSQLAGGVYIILLRNQKEIVLNDKIIIIE